MSGHLARRGIPDRDNQAIRPKALTAAAAVRPGRVAQLCHVSVATPCTRDMVIRSADSFEQRAIRRCTKGVWLMAWIRPTAAISTALVLTTGGLSSTSALASSSGTAKTAGDARSASTVRLVTGDRVTVTPGSDGRRSASVVPGPGRRGIVFRTYEQDDGTMTVLPSDAAELVAAGTLDRRLFDITALIVQGYDEAGAPALPLIVSPEPGGAAAGTAASRKAAATTADRLSAFNTASEPERRLESIDATALRVDDDLGAFWKTLRPAGTARLAQTPRVWLDGRVAPALDRSTAQIGAPAAWKAGFEGQGVKVAVLDTGVDAGHPDLAGRIADSKDFSDSGNVTDHFGHGTHVASIVGGSGAASDGTRRGVAPQADLLIGKVLGDDGYGTRPGEVWAASSATSDRGSIEPPSVRGSATGGSDGRPLAMSRGSAREAARRSATPSTSSMASRLSRSSWAADAAMIRSPHNSISARDTGS